MRVLRVFVFDIVAPGIVIGWLLFKYPDLLEGFVPWLMFGIVWHLTWEVSETHYFRSKSDSAYRKWGKRPMTWLIVFSVGGCISLGYWALIRQGLKELPQLAKKPSDPPLPVSPNKPADTKPNEVEQERLRIEREQLALNYAPSVYVLYQNGRVEIHNNGRTNIALWGGTYGAIPAVIEKEPRIIVPGTYYYIFAEEIEKRMLELLENGQAGFTPCHVFIKTQDGKKHTVKSLIVADRKNGAVSIHVQNLETVDGWGNDVRSPQDPRQPFPTNQNNAARTPLAALIETNKRLTEGDRQRLSNALFDYGEFLDKANTLWGEANRESGQLSQDWGTGSMIQKFSEHRNTLLELNSATKSFAQSFTQVRERWKYYQDQSNYIFGENPDNNGPNTIINAVDEYVSQLDEWGKIQNKQDETPNLFRSEQLRFEESIERFGHWEGECKNRLEEMRKSF